MSLRALYVDLDGTLLGRGASLLHSSEGEFSLDAVRALQACDRAGVEVVIFSGRRRAQVFEDARLIGQSSFIYEAGAAVSIDGEEEWLTDGIVPGELTIHDQIEALGAPALLLDAFAGRLEFHEPWHRDREVSHLFRGYVDSAEADALLADRGLGQLRLLDNGAIHRRSPTLTGEGDAHAYHLVPRGVSKARAVARHMQVRGFAREETIACGDSREDLGAASVVGTFWLMRNAVEKDPSLAEVALAAGNVRVTEGRNGAGVYEAVVTTLAQ